MKNAITVENVFKQFTIPHERTNTLKGAFVNILRKKTYESFYALKNVSFEVKKGEFFGILEGMVAANPPYSRSWPACIPPIKGRWR